jgi:cell division protein FtsI (penicillin-binding protein 3)
MARLGARLILLQLGFACGLLAVIARAAQLQILQGRRWADEADRQRRAREILPARRGSLLDRNGVPLAVTQEFYHVGIAPNEVEDRRALVQLAGRSLGVGPAALEREFASGKRYLYFHGPFSAAEVQPLRRVTGVHLESEFRRFYPSGGLARPIIGAFSGDSGHATAGLELALDSILTGSPGEAVVLKDRAGRRYDSPARVVRLPTAGLDVRLTLDAELQDIAERGLDDAILAMHARGGDVVFLDPRSGELLALASRQAGTSDPAAARPATLSDPFEPGSTAKLFTAAALLSHRLVDSTDRVFAENGEWDMAVGTAERPRIRRISDAHRTPGSLTLAQAIQVSSNVAMAKFSLRLSPGLQFDALRDFGFGCPTGVEFPAESRGRLARPDRWRDRISGPSIAMGYELGVTPVQLAAAYGAIANDGVLLVPTLVHSVLDAEGRVRYRHQPEPIRRAVSPAVAARLREFLRGAVGEGGTGERAQLVNYSLLGKTGTAVRFEGGRYVPGEYTASFAALFPAAAPQLVVIVKIDDPKGQYYGGLTAAPVTRRMLDQALSARRVAIDRRRLVPSEAGERLLREKAAVEPSVSRVVVPWPSAAAPDSAEPAALVPNLVGVPVRRATVALHRRGFRVAVNGLGLVTRTDPAAGDSAAAHSTVTVWAQ